MNTTVNSYRSLGFVRKILGEAAQRASQRDHRSENFCQLVLASADPVTLFERAEHPLDDVALPAFQAVELSAWAYVSSFAAGSQATSGTGRGTSAGARHHRPCLPATSDSAYGDGLACQEYEFVPEELGHSKCRCPDPATRQSGGEAVGVVDHVNLGGQTTSAAPQSMLYRLF